ncbi:MAG TPA: hypothetical protein DCZ11_01820 [Gammaproteobacteria bacterium]|nr:hypothetical protein [Gammaproteobacteria bacterium]MCH77161.1 hypothetical protein [Gammaproteobacteria bacterium]
MDGVDLTPLQQRAADLAEIAWRNVDFDRWDRRKVWEQFTDRVRLAATTTSTLPRYWTVLSAAMGVYDPQHPEARARLASILTGGDDRALLRLMREETELVVLVVRLRSEGRAEERKRREAGEQAALI